MSIIPVLISKSDLTERLDSRQHLSARCILLTFYSYRHDASPVAHRNTDKEFFSPVQHPRRLCSRSMTSRTLGGIHKCVSLKRTRRIRDSDRERLKWTRVTNRFLMRSLVKAHQGFALTLFAANTRNHPCLAYDIRSFASNNNSNKPSASVYPFSPFASASIKNEKEHFSGRKSSSGAIIVASEREQRSFVYTGPNFFTA